MFSLVFFVLMIFILFNFIVVFFVFIGGIYGIFDWLLMYKMVEFICDSYGLMMFIVIIYYSGEIVWCECGLGMGDIVDVILVFNFVFWVFKLFVMWVVIVLLYVIGIIFMVIF